MSGKFATVNLYDEITENDRIHAENCLTKINALALAEENMERSPREKTKNIDFKRSYG